MSENNNRFSDEIQLFCRRYILAIRPTGEIIGIEDAFDPNSKIKITSGGGVGLIRLLGINSNLYICFNNNGELYGEEDKTNPGTIFKESFSGSYSTFQTSLESKEWFIGIQKDGKPKNGNRTKRGQTGVRFLPRRSS